MQPGSQPEDIHTILSRFHTWAGKNPGNGNGKSIAPEPGTVREIPYEEAMRHFRQRQKTQTRQASAALPIAATLSAPSEPGPANPEEALTAPAKTARLADAAPLAATAEAKSKPASPARRPPAGVSKAAAAIPSSDRKTASKKAATGGKKTCAQPVDLPTARAVQPKAVRRVCPKSSAQSKPEPRYTADRQKSTALAVRPHTAGSKEPAFKKVLARSVRSVPGSAQSRRKTAPAPDRNRRITTRFTTAEQRRLELAADQAGLTVSAWLRQCALRAETVSLPTAPALPARSAKTASLSQPAGSTLFSAPAPSGLGNWLTLLRQRFLSSPARFSERA